jgi:glycosyltransferase 2 family protein
MVRWFLLIGIAGFFAWSAYLLRADLAEISLSSLRHRWDLILVAALLSLANYGLRILRWRFYLQRLGHRLPLGYTALTYMTGFAYTLSPAKLGEMARARYYLPLAVGFGDTAAAFFSERLLDLLAMVVLAALLARSLAQNSLFAAVAIVVVTTLLVLSSWPWERSRIPASRATGVPRWLTSTRVRIVETLASTRPLLRPAALLVGFTLGLIAWGAEGMGLAVLSSIDPAYNLPANTAVGIYASAVLLGSLSFLPGGLGSTEAVMSALLVGRGYPVGLAVMITLLCRFVTLWLSVCLGWAAVLTLRHHSGPVCVTPAR